MIKVAEEVQAELVRARAKFPRPKDKSHEAFAILKEEVDELWAEVMGSHADRTARMRAEAIQVAAMAMRFVEDVCDEIGRCRKPPVGWSCTRPNGHDGPCAAWPELKTRPEKDAGTYSQVTPRRNGMPLPVGTCGEVKQEDSGIFVCNRPQGHQQPHYDSDANRAWHK